MKKLIASIFLFLLLSTIAFSKSSYFIDNLTIAWKTDKVLVVLAPLGYQSEKFGYIEVPSGFHTDLASVPRLPIVYMALGGRASAESVLHDYLYRINSVPVVTVSEANGIFLEAMESRNVASWIKWPMYYGVCIGGFFSYHKHFVEEEMFNEKVNTRSTVSLFDYRMFRHYDQSGCHSIDFGFNIGKDLGVQNV